MTFTVPENKKSLPSRGLVSSYQIWLEQKSQQDSKLWAFDKNYWFVKGKVYDLSQFAKNHPGGNHWIQYTKGQNITEHYFTHHLNLTKTDKILQKYEIKNSALEKSSYLQDLQERYTFEQNGIFSQVKKRLLQKYSIQQLQDSSKTKKIALAILSLWLISLILASIYHSFIIALFCGYLLIPVTGIAHNFVHLKPSFLKYFYLATGFTPKQWQIMHCLSHHQYTNTLLDYQLQAFEPLGYFIRVMPANKLTKVVLLQITYILMVPFNIILKLFIVPLTKLCKPQWEYVVPLLQVCLIYTLNGNNLSQAIKLFLTIHCFFGFLFTKVTFGGHRVQTLWTQGCQQIKDFGQHSIYTCNDIYPQLKGGFGSFFIMSGFNIHVVHHMFPTIDNQHLYKAHEILLEVCKERGIKTSNYSLFEAIGSVYKNYLSRQEWNQNKLNDKSQ